MITLEEYRDHLITLSYCGYDCTDERLHARKRTLSRDYGYDLLQKIIDDTYRFMEIVLTDETIENGYCSFELEDDTREWISLGLVGGNSSDTLFKVDGLTVSRYIMHHELGDYLLVDIKDDHIPYDAGDGIMGFNHYYSLYMQGFPKNAKEIRDKLFGPNKELIKK